MDYEESEVIGLRWDAFNFEDKTFTIKHKAIKTRKDNKRVILLKEHKKQIEENKKICKNSYNKKYLDYICVNSIRKDYKNKSANVLSDNLTFTYN